MKTHITLFLVLVSSSMVLSAIPEDDARISVVSSMVNVFPDQVPDDSILSDRLNLEMACNERESAQIVIVAEKTLVNIGKVTCSPLRNAAGDQITADNVSFNRVGYVKVVKPTWRGVKKTGYWPDPLLDFTPFECPVGKPRCIWLTVYVPKKTPQGNYKGTISLYSSKGIIRKIPAIVRVWDFTLPSVPTFKTDYWVDFRMGYDPATEQNKFLDMLRMLGRYKTSTNLDVHEPAFGVWYLEKDGSVTFDSSFMKRLIECNFSTLDLGNAGWVGRSPVLFIDRSTGEVVSKEVRKKIPLLTLQKAYLNELCDHIAAKGMLARAMFKVVDESPEPATWDNIKKRAEKLYKAEPRIQLYATLGVHPDLQGIFDIWIPHLAFYDASTYKMVQQGIQLENKKAIPAKVSASSTGGWKNPGFYRYQPRDAYDGCSYTKWIPDKPPTKEKPEWICFEFDKSQRVSGVKLLNYGRPENGLIREIEVSTDGQSYVKVESKQTGKGVLSFDTGEYKAIRIVYRKGKRAFVATDTQPDLPPENLIVGLREVTFLTGNTKKTKQKAVVKVKPSEIWEYNVGANYPSVCIDASPSEIRATGWQCWLRGVTGYLNYGGGQWNIARMNYKRPKGNDPLFWPAIRDNGSSMILYPGSDKVLPSIRLARFRDSVEDHDYLSILNEKLHGKGFVLELIAKGRRAFLSSDAISKNRYKIGQILSEN